MWLANLWRPNTEDAQGSQDTDGCPKPFSVPFRKATEKIAMPHHSLVIRLPSSIFLCGKPGFLFAVRLSGCLVLCGVQRCFRIQDDFVG